MAGVGIRGLIPRHGGKRLALLLSMALTSGCLAPYPEGPDPDQVRLQTDILNLRQTVERLENRATIVREEQDDLRRELNQLRQIVRERDEALTQHRGETDRRLQALDQARAADRQVMIDELTRRISEQLARAAVAARPATPPPATPRTERGRYHEVRPGETLSEIAAAYNVRVNIIVQSNEITDPDRLRVGQRLFIPD